MDLHRAPPLTRTSTTCKTNSGRTSIAKAPPAWNLIASTLYTHQKSEFPQPPAAVAAGGGGGNQRFAGGEVKLPGGTRNFASTVAERRERPSSLLDGISNKEANLAQRMRKTHLQRPN
jgi:hypothetical protein